MRSGLTLIVCVLSLLAGCGGGDGETTPPPPAPPPPAAPPPPPVIGASGGTLTESSGASIVVPAGALDASTTIRIARDSTGSPSLPGGLTPAGSMYVITPHGGDFAEPIEVSFPVPTVTLQPNQQMKLAKAQPGGEWEILEDTVRADGKLTAKVTSFSFFMTVIITYPLPILQFEPYAVTTSINCAEQPCENALGPVNATYTATSNNGQLPAGCLDEALYVQHGEGNNVSGPGSSNRTVTVQLPKAGGNFSLVLPTNWQFQHAFSVGMRCDGWWSSLGWTLQQNVKWTAPPVFPAIEIVRVPAQLDVVEGLPASLEAILFGGAGKGPGLAFVPATTENRAIINWQRSDDNGRSWTNIAQSFENEANPLPFGTGVTYRPWSVSRGFIATATDQGALIRIHACYTVPGSTTAPLPCKYSVPTRINVLQQSSLPAIVTAPRSVLVRTGQTASLSVTTAGAPAPTLQWQSREANSNAGWTNVTSGTGATSANYVTAATSITDNGTQYRVVLSNALGSTISIPVTVSVSDLDVAPAITTQPASLNVVAASDAIFAVDARGTEALSYQWFASGTAIDGANGPVLRIPGVTLSNAGSYRVTVTNAAGSATSNPAVLVVTAGAPAAVAPTIVTQPASVTVNVGNTATLAVGVDGSGPLSFQWRRDGANISGATSAVLTFNSVGLPNAGTFSVVVSNGAGSVTSGNAVLDVSAASTPTAPTITSQPATLIVPFRGAGVVAVGATGSGPLSYQWSKDGAELPGATLPVLDFRIVADADVGTYTVTVTNSVGSVVSRAVDIILLGAPVITQQPADVTVLEGNNAIFFVAANGSGLRYQWSVNGNPIPGATAATLNTGPRITANSGAVYNVSVYNGAGLVYSQAAVLTVQTIVAPTITQHPQSVTIQPGQQAQMCVTIGGTPTFDLQLQRWNGASWTPGTDVLVNSNAQVCYNSEPLTLADTGAQYRFLIDNPAGEVATNTATVTVQAPVVNPVTNTTLVSRAWTGGPPDNISNQPSISANGRYVAFVSIGTNVSEDSAINGNAYVRDMLTGSTKLINYGYDGDAAAQGVFNVKLSSDGRYAIFSSRAGDLVPGDTNDGMDIFRRDLLTGANLRLSVLPNGDELENGVGGNGDYQLDISGDGQHVIFLSAYDITGNSSNNGYYHLYHRNLQGGFTVEVAGSSEYQVAYSALSDDGQHVAFAMGVTSGIQSIQLYDVEASSYSNVFTFNASVSPAGLRQGMSVSNNGRYVAFSILAPELLGSPYNQVIVADRNSGSYVVASMNLGALGDGNSGYPEISGDGRYVIFSSIAKSLTNNLATSSQPYLVVRDLVEQNTSIGSLRSNGTEVSAGLFVNDQHALSEDGSTLAFVTDYNLMSSGAFGDQVFAVARP